MPRFVKYGGPRPKPNTLLQILKVAPLPDEYVEVKHVEKYTTDIADIAKLGKLKVSLLSVKQLLDVNNDLIDGMSAEIYKNQIDVILRHVVKAITESKTK